MKRQQITLSGVVLAALVLWASPGLAQDDTCPAGKVLTTIVTPVGKVLEICVPEAAIPTIGGPGDVVIGAICPCFSQDQVQGRFDNDDGFACRSQSGTTSTTGEACTAVICENIAIKGGYAAGEGPDQTVNGDCDYDPAISTFWNPNSFNNFCYPYKGDPITETEARACVAILQTFVE